MGMIRDLPEPSRQSPEVMAIVEEMSDEIVEAIVGSTLMLATCPDDHLGDAESELRTDPDAFMRTWEVLDRRGRRRGMGRAGLRWFRAMTGSLNHSLSTQSLSALVDDCTAGVAQIFEENDLDFSFVHTFTDDFRERFWGASIRDGDATHGSQPLPDIERITDSLLLFGHSKGSEKEKTVHPRRAYRRMRRLRGHGIALTVTGAITAAGCGMGLAPLIIGIILLVRWARMMRRHGFMARRRRRGNTL